MTKTMRKGRHNDKGKGKGNVKKRRVENGKKGEGETKGRMKTEEKKASLDGGELKSQMEEKI